MEQVPLDQCIAIDFETYYDDEYSIRKTSQWGYVHDERFDAYLVAIHNDTADWVGDPKDCDWSLCHDKLVLAHNAGFDSSVFYRLQAMGVVPADIVPKGWACTADMAAYLRVKRDLKTAVRVLLDRKRSKAVRSNMKGKTYADAIAAGMEDELVEYGGDDARDCWDLWSGFRDKWPLHEQETSRILRDGGRYGIQADVDLVDAGIKTLSKIRDDALIAMPWSTTHEDKPLASSKIREQGRIDGIPVPASLAATSIDAQNWEDKYSDEFPWVAAIRNYRRTNTFYKKVDNLKSGVDDDGVFHFNVKYFGAHTGRGSGGNQYAEAGGKFNIQNMPWSEMFGVNIRNMLVARPGHVLMVADYNQIEARYLLWLVQDSAFLDVLRKEGNLYQAYAKVRGWYDGNDLEADDKQLYKRTKVTVLQLGYQSGAAKFKATAKSMFGIDFTDEEAQGIVSTYRADNPKIVEHWWSHHRWLRHSARHKDPTHEVALHSGRDLVYFEPHFKGRDVWVNRVRGEAAKKYYGGKLTENEVQAATRDIMCDGRRAVEAARPEYRCLFDAHDEVITEIPLDCAEERAEEISSLLTTSSPWAEGCPIAVGYELIDRYRKV